MPGDEQLMRVLPHRGAMSMLSRVVCHAEAETVCAIEIAEQELFRDEDGGVPIWIGVEYMAQCIAAHAGLLEGGVAPPRIGYLASIRGLRFHCDRFGPTQRLEASVRLVWGGPEGLSAFACTLRDADTGASMADARISCFVPKREGPE